MKPGDFLLIDFGWGAEVVLLKERYDLKAYEYGGMPAESWYIYTKIFSTMDDPKPKIELRHTTLWEGRGKPVPEKMQKAFLAELIAQGLLQ